MDGAIFLQQVVNGMSLGGMYALIAIGYTMVLWRATADQLRPCGRDDGRRV
ncbi:high-affinity branched-chain amino acid transporter permease LivH [Klebsiella variicola]|uniref:High-affinity branched-chain amino acid transporter permease LivH n=1 Tax=Klebsiella variicola TaxID=244366 RepID=A0A7H4ME68_KLEVA|nr:high-affinity branched-chain amino acid transporter permease LivH [Klebsiella variicola]